MILMELYEGGKYGGMSRYIKLIVMVNLQIILKKKIVFLIMEKNTQIGNASTLQIIRLWFGDLCSIFFTTEEGCDFPLAFFEVSSSCVLEA